MRASNGSSVPLLGRRSLSPDATTPDGPFQGFIQRRRQPFGHYVVGFQYPRTDGAHLEGPPVH
jgi:hypothetical protein